MKGLDKKAEYHKYLLSPEWKAFRKRALDFYGRACKKCGCKVILHVHHLTYENIFDEKLEDVIILCGTCHARAHEKKPKVKKRQTNKPKKKKFRITSNNNLRYRTLSYKKPKKW